MTAPSHVTSVDIIDDKTDSGSGIAVTIPSGATLCICSLPYSDGPTTDRTIAGSSPQIGTAVFSQILSNTTSGGHWKQELLWANVTGLDGGDEDFDWDRVGSGDVASGGGFTFSFYKDVNVSDPIRSGAVFSADDGSSAEIGATFDSDTNDLAVGSLGTSTSGDVVPARSSGQTEIHAGVDFNGARLYLVTKAGASSVTIEVDGNFPGMVGFSIKGTVAGGFVPYPNPRYGMGAGAQNMSGGMQ